MQPLDDWNASTGKSARPAKAFLNLKHLSARPLLGCTESIENPQPYPRIRTIRITRFREIAQARSNAIGSRQFVNHAIGVLDLVWRDDQDRMPERSQCMAENARVCNDPVGCSAVGQLRRIESNLQR